MSVISLAKVGMLYIHNGEHLRKLHEYGLRQKMKDEFI